MAVTPGQIVCDTATSDVSTRPIRNSVITAAVEAVEAGAVTVDDALDDVSTNPVENQAITAAIVAVAAAIPSVDAAMSPTSTNPVQNKVIKAALDAIPGATLIDNIANLNSATLQAVQGRVVKEYTDRSSQVKSYDRIVSTAGELAAACTALSAQGYGTLWINGRIVLPSAPPGDTHFRLNGAISLRGLGPHACIHKDDNSTSIVMGFALTGEYGGPFVSGTSWGKHKGVVLSSDMTRGKGVFTAPGLNAEVGDWVLLFSDEPVPQTEVIWHGSSNPAHPAEMHMIRSIDGTDVYRIDNTVNENFVTRTGPAFTVASNVFTSASHGLVNGQKINVSPDNGNLSAATTYYVINQATNTFQLSLTEGGGSITTTTTSGDVVFKPRAWIVPMKLNQDGVRSDVVIDNLLFTSSKESDDMLLIEYMDGLEITNCRFGIENEHLPSPQIYMAFCANVNIHNNICEGSYQESGVSTGYHLIGTIVTNVRLHHNLGRRIRHWFTTGGHGVSSGTLPGSLVPRWGGPINTVIEGNVIHHSPRFNGEAQPAIDSHAEGYGIVIQNNLLICGEESDRDSIGIGCRSRRCVIKNNVCIGNTFSKGIRSSTSGTTIIGNVVLFCGGGIQCNYITGSDRTLTLGCIVKDNVLIGVSAHSGGAGIYTSNGGDNVIEGNVSLDALGTALTVFGGHRNKILNNTFINNGALGEAACMWFDNAAADSADDTLIMGNTFIGYRKGLAASNSLIAWEAAGDNNQIINNTFVGCNVATYITLVGGTGWRVSDNKAWKQANTNFIALGTSIDETDIKIIGNTADGYGAGSLGLTGTNAAAVTAAYDSKNWID